MRRTILGIQPTLLIPLLTSPCTVNYLYHPLIFTQCRSHLTLLKRFLLTEPSVVPTTEVPDTPEQSPTQLQNEVLPQHYKFGTYRHMYVHA